MSGNYAPRLTLSWPPFCKRIPRSRKLSHSTRISFGRYDAISLSPTIRETENSSLWLTLPICIIKIQEFGDLFLPIRTKLVSGWLTLLFFRAKEGTEQIDEIIKLLHILSPPEESADGRNTKAEQLTSLSNDVKKNTEISGDGTVPGAEEWSERIKFFPDDTWVIFNSLVVRAIDEFYQSSYAALRCNQIWGSGTMK